jgi:HTH-type transcriptional regulator, competence development regulator
MKHMKLEYSKKWYENRIALEGDAEVGAGTPPGIQAKTFPRSNVTPVDTRIAFGTFVALWRRNQGWDAARLAEEAGLDTEEILEIEHDPHCEPEPDAVYKLAKVFRLSPRPLLELAGLIEPKTPRLREEAVRFAARSESVTALNDREREALEAFVSTISETANEGR